jgi:4-hydroxy-2-oxoglutarate aldolase
VIEYLAEKYIQSEGDFLKLEGIYAPVPTPFEPGGSGDIDFGAFRENMLKWAASSLDGLVICGSNGEGPFTSENERALLTSAAKEILSELKSSKKIITGAFQQTTKDTVSCCASASAAGADAVLLLPPHYFKGHGERAAARFFLDVADASPIPVVLYNMPANTGVDMSAEAMLELAAHPNIIGVKDTSGNMTKFAYLASAADSPGLDFSVFCGSGNYFLPALSLGAAGGTLAVANLYPESCRRLWDAYRNGDTEEAKLLQRRLLLASDAVTARFGIPGLKAAMDRAGLYGGPCRKPLLPLGKDEALRLEAMLEEADLDSIEKWRQ